MWLSCFIATIIHDFSNIFLRTIDGKWLSMAVLMGTAV